MYTIKEKRKTEDTCSEYAGFSKSNGIPMDRNTEIPIKYYKYQFHDHMIRNGIWDVFYLPYPRNKYKTWDILIHQYIFSLDYMKRHVQSIQKVSEADHYVVQNLTWSGVYLRITLTNNLLQKVLTLVPLKATGPEVFFSTVTKFLSGYFGSLEETITHTKSLKLKSYPGENFTD